MRRSACPLLVGTAVLTLAIAVPILGQQQPPRDPAARTTAPPAGKALIAGQVVAADTGQPLPNVRVNLDSGGVAGVKAMTTDANGAFEFTELPPARYTLTASKAGFVDSSYGQQQPGSGRPGTAIQLADTQAIKNISLKLAKGGVITGFVSDEFGYPAVGTSVRIFRSVFRNGERALTQTGSATTDDRGQYRSYGLLPGEYVVVATPRSSGGAAAELAVREARMAVEYAAMQEAATRLAEVAKVAEARAVMTTMTSTTPAAAPVQGYAPVYFPSTTTASMAARVALGVSEEKTAIDIRLQVVPFSTINGFVSGASPMPAGLTVYLAETGPVIAMGARTSRVDADGRFSFSAVPPGQYQLFARTPLRPAVASVPAAAGLRSVEAAPTQWLWAQSDLTIAGQPRADVSLTLAPGMTVSGSVAFRGSGAPPVDPARVRLAFLPLHLSPAGAEMELATATGRVDDQGRFTVVGLMPGRYRVTASGAGPWILSSVSVQGREVLDFPLEVRSGEDIGGVTVTFTDRSTTLDGSLQDAGGQPAASYTVVVFADDNRYWTPMSRRIQATRPATDGRFSFKNLPPGEYRLAAVVDPEPGQWFDPEFLRQLAAASTPVRLAEGETKAQDLRVAR